MMHRIPDSERLTHRFAINVKPEEYRQIVDEAAAAQPAAAQRWPA